MSALPDISIRRADYPKCWQVVVTFSTEAEANAFADRARKEKRDKDSSGIEWNCTRFNLKSKK